MTELVTIVLASTNPGKVAELRALFADLPVQLLSVSDVLVSRSASARTA